MSSFNIEFNSIIGPAVTATMLGGIIALMGYIGKLITDNRNEKRKKINTTEILIVEIQEGIDSLEAFIPSFLKIAEERIKSTTHSFFIPVDDALDKVLSLVEEQLLLLPHKLVSNVMKYYRFERCLNEALRELSHRDFASVVEDRKRSLRIQEGWPRQCCQ
ncbi:MAG: hypothetical protein ACRD4W_11925 [Nitrososphaeraceae archaeon]